MPRIETDHWHHRATAPPLLHPALAAASTGLRSRSIDRSAAGTTRLATRRMCGSARSVGIGAQNPFPRTLRTTPRTQPRVLHGQPDAPTTPGSTTSLPSRDGVRCGTAGEPTDAPCRVANELSPRDGCFRVSRGPRPRATCLTRRTAPIGSSAQGRSSGWKPFTVIGGRLRSGRYPFRGRVRRRPSLGGSSRLPTHVAPRARIEPARPGASCPLRDAAWGRDLTVILSPPACAAPAPAPQGRRLAHEPSRSPARRD